MLINTEQDLYAACDQYQGHTITLTKPGHTAWSHLTLQSVGTRTQLNSHIPIIMQVRTDRGTYELTPPFEITQEVQPVQVSKTKTTIASRAVEANLQDLQQLQEWCIDNNVEYPRDVWKDGRLSFAYWQFSDGSKVRYNNMLGLMEINIYEAVR